MKKTDPRILRTKILLQTALVELVQYVPLQEIKISHLTEQATISRVTFYQYYRNVPHVMEELIMESLQHVKDILLCLKGQADIKIIEKLLEHIEQQAKFYRYLLVYQQSFRVQFMQIIVQHLEEIGRENSFALQLGIKKDVLIWRDAAAFLGTIEAWLASDCSYSTSFLAKQFFLLHDLEKQKQTS